MSLRWLTIVLVGFGLLVACAQPEAAATPTPTLPPTPTSAPMSTPTPTSVPTPTPTLSPTPTPTPTPTPAPPPTPGPTATPTPAPTATPTSQPTPTPTATPEPLALAFENQLEPNAIRGSPPDSIPYLVRVAGYNIEDEPLLGLFETPTMSWGRAAAYPGRIVVYVSRSRPESTITVSLSLPDGRRAEATFEHAPAMPAPCSIATQISTPLCISFVRRNPPRSVPGSIPYVFAVTGIDLADIEDLRTAFEHPGSRWNTRITSGSQELIVYVRPSYPSGTHYVALTLPDGRRAEAAFEHVAAEPLPPLPEGSFADFPDAVQRLFNQLPVVDGLHLYVQLDGCPSQRTWNPGRECTDTGGAGETNSANYVHDSREVLLRLHPSDFASEYGTYHVTRTLAHEICHAHQHRMVIEAGLGDTTVRLPAPQTLWPETPEGEAFFEATGWRREGDAFVGAEDEPEGYQVPRWNPDFPAHEDFAEVCARWYMDREGLRTSAPRRFAFAEEWLGRWVPDAHQVPFVLEFLRRQATNLPDWLNSELIYYWFTVGIDLDLLSSSELGVAVESPADELRVGNVIIVGMKPSRPPGTYRVAVTLPDGRHTEIYFEHTAGTSASALP